MTLGVAPMLAPLPAPCVHLGFPQLAIAGGETTRLGGNATPRIEASGQTASPRG
jgi:hypothetical protein